MIENLICEIRVGSHLYGTSNENSDTDIKGVYCPSIDSCILDNYDRVIDLSPNTPGTNTKNDTDMQIFAIQKFVNLLSLGDSNSFDLLHARGENIIRTTMQWEYLYNHRRLFYTKRISKLLGFVLSQTRKYHNRGERYSCIMSIIDILGKQNPEYKLETVWDILPRNPYTSFSYDPYDKKGAYIVIESKFYSDVKIKYVITSLISIASHYGERAVSSRDTYDYKSISHAVRILNQTEELLKTGDIKFPRPNADYLKSIKYGKLDIGPEIFVELEEKVNALQHEINRSSLPETVNSGYINNIILTLVHSFKPEL